MDALVSANSTKVRFGEILGRAAIFVAKIHSNIHEPKEKTL
jgi:hypothetical protein